MNRPVRTIEIDRITLTGLQLTPDRAERIQTQVEAELRRRLQQDGLPQGLAGGQVSLISAPEAHIAEPHSDSSVAGALAGSISHALRESDTSGRR